MANRGDRLAIHARDWNDMQRLVEQYRNGSFRIDAEGPASSTRDPCTVKALNTTTSALPHYAVVGLGEPVIHPADNPMEFARNVAFRIESPQRSRWGILQAPCGVNEFAPCVVSGVTACKLNVDSSLVSQSYADTQNSDFESLVLVEASSCAQVLWREGGTGLQWAIIRIGNAPCYDTLERFQMTSNWFGGIATATFINLSGAYSEPTGLLEDPLGIFEDQLVSGNVGLSHRTCQGRHFVIQAKCNQPRFPLNTSGGS